MKIDIVIYRRCGLRPQEVFSVTKMTKEALARVNCRNDWLQSFENTPCPSHQAFQASGIATVFSRSRGNRDNSTS